MQTNQYTQIKNAIVKDLTKHSVDSVYNNCYPLYKHNKYGIMIDVEYIYNIIVSLNLEENNENLVFKFKDQFLNDNKYLTISNKENKRIFSGEEKDLTSIFKFIIGGKHLLRNVKTLFDTELYAEAKYHALYVEKLDFNSVTEELLSVLNGTIPSPKIFKIFETAGEELPKEAFVTEISKDIEFPFDDIGPIIFSLRKALQRSDKLISESGLIFLNFGNGIYAKILARNNKTKVKPVFCLIQENDTFYREKVTSSGLKINKGLYIVSDNFIFEIYFNVHSFLF
jgi:hypothetical protein